MTQASDRCKTHNLMYCVNVHCRAKENVSRRGEESWFHYQVRSYWSWRKKIMPATATVLSYFGVWAYGWLMFTEFGANYHVLIFIVASLWILAATASSALWLIRRQYMQLWFARKLNRSLPGRVVHDGHGNFFLVSDSKIIGRAFRNLGEVRDGTQSPAQPEGD